MCSNPQRCVAGALALVGGYVDVICFMRYSTFIATMTGNLVITGQTLYEVLGHLNDESLEKPVRGHRHDRPAEAAYLVSYRCMVMIFNCMGAFAFCALQRRYPHAPVKLAAPFIGILAVIPDFMPFVDSMLDLHPHQPNDHGSVLSMWSVCTLAFALGATHFLCSPAADGSRLKAVTMAATGHMHGVTKLCYRRLAGDQLKPSDYEKMWQSTNIFSMMAAGALLGAACLHLNPIGDDPHDFLLVPVGLTLVVALTLHDTLIEPPGGWPAADLTTRSTPAGLKEPLAAGAGKV